MSEQQVMDLVDLARAALENDTPGTLKSINAGQEPFVDPAKPQLHPMVYDMNVKLVANPDPDVSGQSMKGKPDAVGKLLRDEIVAGALDRGSGWVTYVYAQPGKAGLFQKAAYYKLSEGSDGKLHAVCAGRYLGPFAGTPSPGATAAAAPTQAEVQTFVKKALAYAQENGKAAALKAFAAPGGEFHQGELYVYAYDFNGTVIA
ncbi:MAG: cache domain-containing protein, partial [Actinomycetes bacterium]